MLDRAIDHLMRLLEFVISAILAVMVILVFGNVALRYGFNSGITVSEEVSRYLFVWLTFLGAVVAVREHTHLGVDSLVRKLSRNWQITCVIISELAILGISVIFFLGSLKQVVINQATVTPVTGMSLSLLYIPGVISSVSIGLLVVLHLYRVIFTGVHERDLILSVESEEVTAFEQRAQLVQRQQEIKS